MWIKHFLQAQPVTVEPTTSIRDAAQAMREHHVGDVIVTSENNGTKMPVGIVTDRDIVVEVVAAGVDIEHVTVGDIMSEQPVTGNIDADVDTIIEIMRRRGVRRLPLVDSDGTLVSVVSLDDLLGLAARQITSLYALVLHQRSNECASR